MKTKNTFGKRILSLVLTVLLVLSLIPMSVFSAFAEELSEAAEGLTGLSATIDTCDTIALKDADDDGYYDISNADELYAFAQLVNGGNLSINAELTANIVVNEGVMTSASTDVRYWTPIGGKDNEYEGTFDGNSKTISGLYFNDDTVDYVGLFGYANGTIKNTGVINSYFYGYNCVSAIIGYNYGEISNCYSTSEVNGIGQYTGGVVGFNRSRYITGCYNTGKVTGDMNVGGISGYSGGYIVNCYNTGKVTGDTNVGGVTGYSSAGVKNSYNTGTVSGGSSSQSLGGLIGFATNGRISSCYSTGTVSGGSYVYGLIGQDYNNNSTITNCYYLDTAGNLGINGVDTPGSVEAKTASSFASGEVAYLLQGEQEELVWGQKIGTDTVPVLGGDKVYYGYTSCDDADNTIGYTNTVTSEEAKPGHNFENGFCTVCDAFEPATDENNDGVYEISNAGQLYWFAEYVNAVNTSANAILTADIVVNEGTVTESSTDVRAWTPIGNYDYQYTGTFDGNNHTVSGLYFNNSEAQYVGLFGYIGENSEVKNTGVINSYIKGNSSVGGVVGYNNVGTMTNCYNTGSSILGVDYVGGVVGFNKKTITNCYNTSDVSGEYSAGGFVGRNTGSIANCYNTGNVTGDNVGGIVYDNYGTITNCYNSGKINGSVDTQNGIACFGNESNRRYGMFTQCYYIGDSDDDSIDGTTAMNTEQFASGEVAYLLQGTQTEEIWGQKIGTDTAPVLGGDKVYSVTNCKGEVAGYNNTGNETLDHNFVNGFCTVCDVFVPATDENEDGVFEIANAGQLYWFAEYVNAGNTSANAILTADIVVNEGVMTSASTDARAWTPIGNNSNKYAGTFDGNGKTVSGLCFNNSEAQYVGLFGVIGEDGEVKNIGVINSYFNADKCVGGVAGYNFGTVTNCYNAAEISADKLVGGIVGCSYGVVANSYNTGKVNGDNCVSGVVGTSQTGTIINCYNTGEVSGTSYVGGIVGESYSATIANCYNTGTVYGNYYFGAIFGYGRNYDASNCYYLDSSCSFGTGDDSVYGPITSKAKTSAEFASGEVAYLLQSEQTEAVWGQKIGTDEIPVLGGDKVYYGYLSCADDATAEYTNNSNAVAEKGYIFVNGFCVFCDAFEPATDENEDGVYEIANAGQLYWFADKVNNDYENFGSADAILTADIVVNEGVMTAESEGARVWTPIGNDSNSYTGTFDGNNKTISGLYFNNSEADYIGLFGFVGKNGAVNNTGVINSYFNGYYFVGGVVGVNAGAITNCYNTGAVSGEKYVGGVLGENSSGTIANSYNAGSVSGADRVGGVVGYNTSGTTIGNCYNEGSVSGTNYVGGVVGSNNGTIANCYNTGEVSGTYYIGGVVGNIAIGTIENCYNTGEVSGSDIGGVVGYRSNGTITNCYYLDTACSGGINGADKAGSAEAKTAEQFKSGEVAYLLGDAFGQKIGTDELPTLGGDKVYYGYASCADDVAGYTNNSNVVAERPDHNFVNGSCTACGVNALFYAERTVDYDGDVSDESKYFMQLEDALRYAEKSTQNITTYYSECATVKILCNYAIDESVTVTVPSNVTLDLNGFELTNNGTINFESIDGFKVSGGNYTGDGAVKIDEYDGIIFENTLYYFGGEYTPGSSDKRDLAQEKDRTYFTAGEGYAVYKNADGAVLNLYNATINSNESAQSGAYTSAIYYSGSDSLTVNFYGENNLYSKAAADVLGIYANFGLVLNGLGENPIININCENATAFSNGIVSTDITINSGIVNIVIDNSGEFCIGIDGENITVANDAEINITTGDASRRSVGIYANSSIVNEGEINTSFGEADTSAGVMVTGTNKISNKGTMNALVLQRIATDDGLKDDYYTSGDVVVNKGFSPFIEEEYNHAFTVAEGTSLLINEDASFDLSILSAEDITIEGEVAVDGRLILPEGVSVLDIKDKITSTTDGGTVRVGDNSYCFENGKLKCTSEECHLTADDSTNVANCKHKAVCDICGTEYGDIDEYNHAGELIPEFRFDTPYETEDSKECYAELYLTCADCNEFVASTSGYASLVDTKEPTDCMNPGYEVYETTFEIDGVYYPVSHKVTLKSDNHVGEFTNGFCTECGGYQPATLNDNGTPDDEWDDYYEISNAGQLYWFAEHATNDQYSKAVLTDDIIVNEDMSAENLREWIAIGESSSMPYCGTFDGQGHFISGLYAKSELNYIGLFGAIGWGASISNLGIKDSYFEGNYYVGGIVGYNDFSYIKNCYAEDVEVVAVSSGGALVGYNYGEVSNSYSTTDSFVGNNNYGTITNCYYLAEEETDYIDGTTAKTADAFASGEVAYLLQAGVVGEEIWDDELGDYVQTEPEEIWGQKIGTDSYPVLGGDKVYYGYVSCAEDATAVYTNDKNATDEKPDHNFVNGFCTVGGEFESATLNSQGFYEISNAGQLYWFADKVNNDYANFKSVKVILTDNIVVNEGVMSADSKNVREWIPIGTSISKRFAGVFYGNNKTISGLYCNNEDYDIAGLFGYSEATIAGVGVINSYFSGASVAGSIAGCYIGGRKIENCYSTSIVNAANAGGIVGHTFAVVKVQNCYFTGEVTGTNVGGIVGYFEEDFTGTITNCYYLSTVCSGGINGSDLKGSAEAKTIEHFKSGEVAYLLQGEQSQEIWGQEIGTDTYPVFGGDKVYYGYTSCADDVMVYTNNEDVSDKKLSHDWNNGVCSGCNKVCEHNFEKGFCTVCGAMDGIAQVKGYTISLKENIAVNYYMVLADEVIADENAKMVFTVPNGTKSNPNNTEIVEIAVKDIIPTNDGYYVFTCEVAAKEMASVIKAQIIMSDGTASNVFEYTVKEYAEHMLANPDTYAKEQALVKAMLNYGGSAQVYFNYNADNLANNTKYMSDEEKVVNLYGFAGAGYTLEGEEAGVKYYGTALSLESELAFKHYFIIDSSVNVDELTIDCKYDAKLKKSGNLYELKISGIPAHQVATDVTVKLGNTSLTYSIASYGELIQNNGDTALWTVVSALTDYSFEASLYANK